MYEINWDKLKDFIDSRSLMVHYVDMVSHYLVSAYDGPLCFYCELPKGVATEFENNYKDSANSKIGSQEISGIKNPNGMRARLVGAHKDTVAYGTTGNCDWIIPQLQWQGANKTCYFDGIRYRAYNAHKNDTIEFQVVDKDGVGVDLGWYTQAEFDAMGEYMVEEFGTSYCVDIDSWETITLYKAVMIVGMYVRVKYHSQGTTDVDLKCNLFRHLDGNS